METQERSVTEVIIGQETSDGAGVRLKRSLGSHQLSQLDPFLLFDEFRSDQASDYIGGFPSHPHRGFETVTYMMAGSMEHKDSSGNTGNLIAGSAQWMTAGSGIIHSEMPKQENGLMWGFQLWVNLPASDKMTAPRYQDIPPSEIPEITTEGGAKIRVVAGRIGEVQGPIQGISTDPTYLDIQLEAGQHFDYTLPENHTSFIYAFEGSGDVGETATLLEPGNLGVLSKGSKISVEASEGGFRFLLIAGKPLNEPVARYGPFVMNTKQEIQQAIHDYETGQLVAA